jgi:hypothetical protein
VKLTRDLCPRDYKRWLLYGDPTHVEPPRGNSKGDDVGYKGMHDRVRQLYGDATENPCRQCGKRADQWAYDHADPDERQDRKQHSYSIDPAHYLPLCHSCHRKLDRKAPLKTHCPQGHPYDEANTHWRRSGWRDCRACNRERARRNALKSKQSSTKAGGTASR